MPTPQTLHFLSYNTHLFTGTVVADASWFSERLNHGNKTEYDDQVRVSAIINKILARKPDIAVLTEVWSNDSKQMFVSGLRDILPYSQFDNIPVLLGSGLLLLSRFPLSGQRFEIFKDLNGIDSMGSQKGFLTTTVELGEARFLVCATHTQAGNSVEDSKSRASNIGQIQAELEARDPSGSMPAIVLGDMNVIGEQADGTPTAEYHALTEAMGKVQMTDIFRSLYTNSKDNPGFTYDGTKNALVRIFATEDGSARQRLDYIFARKFKPTAASVLSDFLYQSFQASHMDLSDHYPLECVCTLDP
jgi:endonuclease/exonuclease/phosphatase family metal-dependent hydrolase